MILGNKETDNTRLRYNILTMIVYIIGLILIVQLFNLQIVKGREYREESNAKLTRETTIEAARGSIRDRTGIELASTELGYSVELYKTKIDTETFNKCILNVIKLLEKNGDTYTDTFPISINPYAFNFKNDEALKKWKTTYKLAENATAEECFNYFKNKYEVNCETLEDTRKVIGLIYQVKTNGYSTTKSITIAKSISNESVQEFYERAADFPGINVVTEPIRTYNKGSLASHVIGYIAKINEEELKTRKDKYSVNDYIGRTGIESILEEYLKGEDGKKQIDMAVDGTKTGEYITKEAVSGCDVVLTIDANLQSVAEESLKYNIERIRNGEFEKTYEARGGSLAVVNVKTGEILALASYPDYEPTLMYNGISQTKYNEYLEQRALFNRAISGAYAPGSIFKMVTAVAGLETGVISRTEKIKDTGVYNKYNETWHCWYYTDYHKGHGYLNVQEAIQKSCNYFFYETGDRMGIETLSKYAKHFGLGEKTGVELPSETAGTLASKENSAAKNQRWNPGDTLNAAIGQGDNSFSPIQMARYLSILVNGGNKIDLTIIKSVLKADKTEVDKSEIEQFVNNKLGITETEDDGIEISKENIDVVLEGMRSVALERGGTAYSVFKDFNIEIGGKTGSAETSTNDVNAWFAAFAPYDDPEIAVIVMIENGGKGSYSAQVVKDIIAEYFGMNANGVQEDMTAIPYTESMR